MFFQGAEDEELSDDELPPDIDLSDPFFAEELGTPGVKRKQKGRKQQQEAPRPAAEGEEEEELERQKAEMALLMEDDVHEAKRRHFNYDKIVEQQNLSKKKKKKLLKKAPLEEDHFQLDVADPRFQAMFTSPLFSLDPSHPSYKQTRATQSILAEKQRRREEAALGSHQATPTQEVPTVSTGTERDAATAKTTMDPNLSLLVKSIKNKTEQFQARKKQKLL